MPKEPTKFQAWRISIIEVYVDMEDFTYKDLIVAMGIKGIEYSECVQKYLDHGVTVFERLRSSMYSKRIVEALGIEGAIRVSPLHCNSTEEYRCEFRESPKNRRKRQRFPLSQKFPY
ncbi:MAG: hypothetical protein ACLTLQ_03170 [[Clostridium] scindens]